ncbi:hypothetical protein PV04_01239 [Phialophora macrospora]|uniref:Zn(2)-C6 fungal-type domain-containing protein n=1 Tax=Phialophora macrospora TaxID=1851006 RepID=A0A0D2G2R2_9EURO|nr:hypothetical protein PV04_01239 [Phialophora macrospora]
MVYCGVVSKGCQRCRQRKVKCDERRPGCMRCEKSKAHCPGYRDLVDLMFRDESGKVLQKFSATVPLGPSLTHDATITGPFQTETPSSRLRRRTYRLKQHSIPRPLSMPIDNLGASFFFAKYSFNEEPFFSGYHDWLAHSYLEDGPSNVLRAAIDAVGLAGLSNVSYAPELESKSKEQYCNVLTALKKVLADPARVVENVTLMAVILLILFEVYRATPSSVSTPCSLPFQQIVNFQTWDRYHCWEAHVKAAAALLELRGQKQFDHDRGGQLYIQSRSHILLACMQQSTAVPSALVQTTYNFQTSTIRRLWRERKVASPGSISEISFRIINLRAALNCGEITDPAAIRATLLELDDDLEAWRVGLNPSWKYSSVYDPDEASSGCWLKGHRHLYPNNWIADAWNNWRGFRIIVKQMILDNEAKSATPDIVQNSHATSVIQEMSADICISIQSFRDHPRILSLIQPLYFVALTRLNTPVVRGFAVEQLRRIAASTGVRQAALLADTAAHTFDK